MAHWLLLLLTALPALGQNPLTPENMLPGCPDIVSKSEWGALSSNCVRPLNLPVEIVLVSHTASDPCFSPADCEQQMRLLQRDHVQIRGFCDIVYNFLIGEDGLIYEGRGWSTQGAHSSAALNSISLGISFIGNFQNRSPNSRALRAMQSLLRCGLQHGALASQYIIRGEQGALDFPANRLYGELRKLPRYRE
ncbi:peptidoglycan recognition protein 1 [Trichosurus vulpecula]|uniref:peptidoglycan recognition protein 1 n=1 Tax=Trichosurus vulpecula TaxID=9337 RepID=UPI00186B523E|nr:peptidoglycan recognition protein 1 [Trichosurus vulpecula]